MDFAKYNRKRFAVLVEIGERLAQSEDKLHLICNSKNRELDRYKGGAGFKADGMSHELGFYYDFVKNDFRPDGEIMLGVVGGGYWGVYNLAVDKNGNAFVVDEKNKKKRIPLQEAVDLFRREYAFGMLISMMDRFVGLRAFERRVRAATS